MAATPANDTSQDGTAQAGADQTETFTIHVTVDTGTDRDRLVDAMCHGINTFASSSQLARIAHVVTITDPDGTALDHRWDNRDLLPDTPPPPRRRI